MTTEATQSSIYKHDQQDFKDNVTGSDFWRYKIGCNVIPADSKNKSTHISWGKWQNNQISEEQHKEWKNAGAFNNGIAVIAGKLWNDLNKDKYLACIDCDNKKGFNEFLGNCFPEIKTLEELSQKTIVEQHLDNKDKAHVYYVVEKFLKNRKINGNNNKENNSPIIEIKSEGKSIVMCSPSIHEDGCRYKIIGTKNPLFLDAEQSAKLEESINQIHKKYSSNDYNASTGNFCNLSDELRNIAKTLRIDDNLNYKIGKGNRNNVLLSFAESMLHYHNLNDVESLHDIFLQVNQKLCEYPLDGKEVESIWIQATRFMKKNIVEKNSINNNSHHSKGKQTQTNEHSKPKKEFTIFKYTSNYHIYESVIIAEKPFFITFEDGKLILREEIEQETRVLKPPHREEYPSKPYMFESKEELEKFVNMIKEKEITIDSLFWKTNEFVFKFIVHHSHILEYISGLILFSYFQDKFPTIPYTMFVSDGGSGKSTIGNVFEDLGYRCVNMTDPTTANIFRIFGTIEAGQCTIVLDEAEKIDQDKDMMSILKNGYENGKRVQRVDQNGKQHHFHTFGLKILSAERAPNPSQAKGVIDRTFIISNYKGKPELDIKEIRKPKTSEYKNIFADMEFLRKSLFVYRLVHFNDEIADIETGLEGRDKELCKPILQLFYSTKSQKRIERIFEILLDEKNDRKANSLERDVLEVIVSLFDRYPNGIISFLDIWLQLADKTNGTINERKNYEMETEIYGTIYKTSLAKMMRDRFSAKGPKNRKSQARSLEFDIERTKDHLKQYRKETPTKISCYQKISDSSDSNSKDPFDSFFSFEPSLEINTEQNDESIASRNLSEKGVFQYHNNESNSQVLSNTVTTVTAVTNENQICNQLVPNQDLVYENQEQNSAIKLKEKDIINSCSRYRYTPQKIEEFFASDNWQVKEHSFEDSICRPLIGKQIHKPFFHYCKICPKVENIHLKSIEDHIRLKDPERHKAKLLELIQEG